MSFPADHNGGPKLDDAEIERMVQKLTALEAVIDSWGYTQTEALILAGLILKSNRQYKEARPSVTTMQRFAKVRKRDTIHNALNTLEHEKQLIKRESRPGLPSMYEILPNRVMDAVIKEYSEVQARKKAMRDSANRPVIKNKKPQPNRALKGERGKPLVVPPKEVSPPEGCPDERDKGVPMNGTGGVPPKGTGGTPSKGTPPPEGCPVERDRGVPLSGTGGVPLNGTESGYTGITGKKEEEGASQFCKSDPIPGWFSENNPTARDYARAYPAIDGRIWLKPDAWQSWLKKFEGDQESLKNAISESGGTQTKDPLVFSRHVERELGKIARLRGERAKDRAAKGGGKKESLVERRYGRKGAENV